MLTTRNEKLELFLQTFRDLMERGSFYQPQHDICRKSTCPGCGCVVRVNGEDKEEPKHQEDCQYMILCQLSEEL